MARALVYAHHDRDGVFDPHVIEALRRYRPLMDHVTVVSTAAQQLPVEMRSVVDRFLARDNIGYDFSSWRAGIEALGQPDRFDEIVCANDVSTRIFCSLSSITSSKHCNANVFAGT